MDVLDTSCTMSVFTKSSGQAWLLTMLTSGQSQRWPRQGHLPWPWRSTDHRPVHLSNMVVKLTGDQVLFDKYWIYSLGSPLCFRMSVDPSACFHMYVYQRCIENLSPWCERPGNNQCICIWISGTEKCKVTCGPLHIYTFIDQCID